MLAANVVVQERRLMREMLHPFILTLHGHFSTNTKLYMVLKLAEGDDLSLRLANEPKQVCAFCLRALWIVCESNVCRYIDRHPPQHTRCHCNSGPCWLELNLPSVRLLSPPHVCVARDMTPLTQLHAAHQRRELECSTHGCSVNM